MPIGFSLVIGGKRYISSGEAARRIGVSQRTLPRWVARQKDPTCPPLLMNLETWEDPLNGYVFFLESGVNKIVAARPQIKRARKKKKSKT